MSRRDRILALQRLQAARGDRLLIAYVTSTRPNYEIQMGDDVLPLLYEHLEAAKAAAKQGVDLFIHSNGGSGTVPWRIVSLIREYTSSFAVLVPHRAFSAATLVALGADEIVMHRMGCLGPIDPSVSNLFNPPHPTIPGQSAPISVEDVSAYFKLVQAEVGIQHEDELIQAFTALTDKIHPLALGNVQRSHHQSRMMARKLLRQHVLGEGKEHEIDQIIDNLKSNLFFHGHPINRAEAKQDLNLKVLPAGDELEEDIWNLYRLYSQDLKLEERFDALHEWKVGGQAPPGTPPTVAEIVQQMKNLAQNGIGIGAVTEEQFVKLAAALVPVTTPGRAPGTKVNLERIPGAYVESINRSDVFRTDLGLELVTIQTAGGAQEAVRQQAWSRWEREDDEKEPATEEKTPGTKTAESDNAMDGPA